VRKEDEHEERKGLQRVYSPVFSVMPVFIVRGVIVPPTRVTTAIKTTSGQKMGMPPLALEPGKSTRQQVESQYRAFAVDSGVPNLFWARYLESRWYVAVYPAPQAAFGKRAISWSFSMRAIT
jgi:hypothetical protein